VRFNRGAQKGIKQKKGGLGKGVQRRFRKRLAPHEGGDEDEFLFSEVLATTTVDEKRVFLIGENVSDSDGEVGRIRVRETLSQGGRKE